MNSLRRLKDWILPTTMRKRLALVLAFAFLPTGVMAMQSGWSALSAERMALLETRVAAEVHELGLARETVSRVREIARAVAANPDVASRTTCREALTRLKETYPNFTAIVVLDNQAQVVCAANPDLVGVQTRAMVLLQEALEDRPAIGAIVNPVIGGEPVLAAVAPMSARVGAEPLYIGLTWPAAPLLQATPDQSSGQLVGSRALVDAEGRLLLSAGQGLSDGMARAAALGVADTAISATTPYERDGHSVVGTVIEEGRLYLLRGWSTPLFDGALILRLGFALLAPIVLWGAALAAAWFAIEVFCAGPVHTVERLARAYASGADAKEDEARLVGAPVEITSLKQAIAGMFVDLRRRERQLSASLEEERALLREVNHRVRNNLQMVASILSIQARAAGDASEARGLQRAQERVQLLALAYRRIYGSGEVRQIALDELAREVAATIILSRPIDKPPIVTYQLERVYDTVGASVPFAFLVGECLADILETDYQIPELTVSLSDNDGDVIFQLCGEVSGPVHTSAARSRLITAFARQIGASVQVNPTPGVLTRIKFKKSATAA